MSFKKQLLTAAVLLTSSLGFAHEELLCVGGIKNNNHTTVLELTSKDSSHDSELVGTLPTPQGTIVFGVESNQNDYRFKVQILDASEMLIDEVVPTLPALRSKTLPDGQEVYIDCKPFNMADYCRIHTC